MFTIDIIDTIVHILSRGAHAVEPARPLIARLSGGTWRRGQWLFHGDRALHGVDLPPVAHERVAHRVVSWWEVRHLLAGETHGLGLGAFLHVVMLDVDARPAQAQNMMVAGPWAKDEPVGDDRLVGTRERRWQCAILDRLHRHRARSETRREHGRARSMGERLLRSLAPQGLAGFAAPARALESAGEGVDDPPVDHQLEMHMPERGLPRRADPAEALAGRDTVSHRHRQRARAHVADQRLDPVAMVDQRGISASVFGGDGDGLGEAVVGHPVAHRLHGAGSGGQHIGARTRQHAEVGALVLGARQRAAGIVDDGGAAIDVDVFLHEAVVPQRAGDGQAERRDVSRRGRRRREEKQER